MEHSAKFNMRVTPNGHLLSAPSRGYYTTNTNKNGLPRRNGATSRRYRRYREVFEKASHAFGWVEYVRDVYDLRRKKAVSRTAWKLAVDPVYAANFLSKCETLLKTDGEGHYGPTPRHLLYAAGKADSLGAVYKILTVIKERSWRSRRFMLHRAGSFSKRRANLPTGLMLFGVGYDIKYSTLKALARASKKTRLAAKMLLIAENKTALTQEDWVRAIEAAKSPHAIPEGWLSHKTIGLAWILGFGRAPQNESIRAGFLTRGDDGAVRFNVPLFRAALDSKTFVKGMMRLLKLINADDEGFYESHDVLAMFKLAAHLGANADDLVRKSGLSVHDAGIDLPDCPPRACDAARQFLMANAIRWRDAALIYAHYDQITQKGIDPSSPSGFTDALAYIHSLMYVGVDTRSIKLAAELGALRYTQSHFETAQEVYLNMLEEGVFPPAYETLPLSIKVTRGDLTARFLKRGDFKALVIGALTGCCQHIGGDGSSCAWHSFASAEGGVLVIEHKGKIAFQSWVWRNGDDVVFDNVEGDIKKPLRESAKELYTEFAKHLLGKLGIKRVWVGTSNSDLTFPEAPRDYGPALPENYVGHSDASIKWLVADIGQKEGSHE